MLLTWPYLPHSSFTSSRMSSYSSSSSSSSGATMFIRHSTSVGMPPIWLTELFISPGTCRVTGGLVYTRLHCGILGTHARPLDQELLIAQLHTIETRNGLIVHVDVHIFTEGVSFREASGTVLNKVESLQGAKGCQKLLHLVIIQVVGQSANE